MEVEREVLELDVMVTHEFMILLTFCIARRLDCLLNGAGRPGDVARCIGWSLP